MCSMALCSPWHTSCFVLFLECDLTGWLLTGQLPSFAQNIKLEYFTCRENQFTVRLVLVYSCSFVCAFAMALCSPRHTDSWSSVQVKFHGKCFIFWSSSIHWGTCSWGTTNSMWLHSQLLCPPWPRSRSLTSVTLDIQVCYYLTYRLLCSVCSILTWFPHFLTCDAHGRSAPIICNLHSAGGAILPGELLHRWVCSMDRTVCPILPTIVFCLLSISRVFNR